MTPTASVGKMTVRTTRSSVASDVAYRLRIDTAIRELLADTDTVEPSGVLIIRRLTLLAQRGRQAGLDQLAALRRAAARPGRGPIDPSAEAVFFDDEAELLACLTRDVIDGRTANCWWWR